MKKILGICGLNCGQCGAFIATKENSDEKREAVAEKWRKEYGKADLKTEDVNCLGCLSKIEPTIYHCKECNIRKCGFEKEVENCSKCIEYPCETISKFLQAVPEAKSNLSNCHSDPA